MMQWLLRSLGLMILLSSLWAPARSSGSALYPHEPGGFLPITEFDMSSEQQGGVTYPFQTTFICDSTVVTDNGAPKSPSSVIRDIWNPTIGCGGSEHYVEPLPANTTESYAAVWWKISSDFNAYASCIEKGFKWDSQGTGGAIWVGLLGCPGEPEEIFISVNMNNPPLFNCTLPNGYGDCPGTRQVRGTPGYGGTTFSRDVWHFVELYTKYSTCSTCADGIIRLWLDGSQTHELTTVNYVERQYPWLNFVIGQAWSSGAGPGPKAHYFDHMYISAPTGGGGTTNRTPPPAPTGLRVL